MKKLFMLLLILPFVAACSSEDEEKIEEKSYINMEDFYDTEWETIVDSKTHSLIFADDSSCSYNILDNDINTVSERQYTYKCQASKANTILLLDIDDNILAKVYFQNNMLYTDLIKGLYYPFKKKH